MTRVASTEDVGKRYNKLTILSIENRGKHVYAKCLCDCGTEKDIRLDGIRSGAVKSCGCQKREHLISINEKHGMCGTNTYSSWQHMKTRCELKNKEKYPYHSGSGITVCGRWLESFENFYEDMGDCPDGFTLDRINSALGYCPDNCRWVNNNLQAFNKRSDEIKGVSFRKDRGKWYASITKNYKTFRLGCFVNYEDAVEARLRAELEIYGEFSAKNLMSDRDD